MNFTASHHTDPFLYIPYHFHGLATRQRTDNGFLSLTDIAIAYDFNVANWLGLVGTKTFLMAAKAVYPNTPEPVLTVNGGANARVRGTWASIVVTRRFIQHVDPYLALSCDDIIAIYENTPLDPLQVAQGDPDRAKALRPDRHPYRVFAPVNPKPPLFPH